MLNTCTQTTTFQSTSVMSLIANRQTNHYSDNNNTPVVRKHRFSADALQSLPLNDRLLFENFGQGPIETLPYDCIHHAIEAQIIANPNAVAVEHLGESITYGELDRQANRLAERLTQNGVTTGDNVALFIKRSIPMIVGILATLKVGAAYVPQDVRVAPENQLSHIIETTNAPVILTISEFKQIVPVPAGRTCLAIDEIMSETDATDMPFIPSSTITPDNHCFILFTSGTTGKPNGVQVTHGNVCNILLTAPGDLGIKPGMRVAQILSISFDMAAWEILGCLSHGATLVIRGNDFQQVGETVDVIIATPSVLSRFDPANCPNIKVVAVAGEPCPRPLADKWSAVCVFYNSCGPTETTIINTAQQYLPWSERLTIGKPTPNNTVYILNEEMQPCVIGEIGEMWAGGDCVSAGYLNNDALTQERYRLDPFLGNGRMMFRTRDLGRWTEDGELEHFGRTDDQVKIRGFRVELDSVSGALESIDSCTRAVTLKFDSRSLVAFITPQSADVEAAREAVASTLPYYCTPERIIAIDELPMTNRGKIDKRLLLQMAQELQPQQ